MSIVGIGVDIVDVRRVKNMVERYGERFLQRIFGEEELDYCKRFSDPFPHLAARWAAKEAISKALGTGFSQGVTWKSIQVINHPLGEPNARLYGKALQRANELRVSKIWLSLSHTSDYAVAMTIFFCGGDTK